MFEDRFSQDERTIVSRTPPVSDSFALGLTGKSADSDVYPAEMLTMKKNPDFLIHLDM